MKTVLSMVTSIAGWALIMSTAHEGQYALFGMMLFPAIGVVGSALYILLPSIFSIGPASEEGSLLSRGCSLILVFVFIIAVQFLKRTIFTVGFTSFFLGAAFSYVGNFIAAIRHHKIVGRG